MADIPTLRIVTLGKTGSGKSSLANTLFEEETFSVGHSANSETQYCRSKKKIIDGIIVQLVDTPGFFDNDKQKGTELKEELLKCIIQCAPGPHAFLLTLKVDRYTSQEEAVVDQMIEYFSEEALKFTTVMFTHGDQLPKGKRIEEWVKENESLQKLVQKCGGRCCVIDNKYWNNSQDPYRNNQHQIKQLLKTIYKNTEKKGGNCYTNKVLWTVEAMKESVKVRIKQSSPGISEERLNQEVNKSVFTRLKENWVGVTVGVILGALLGLGSAGVLAGGLLGGVIGGVVSEYFGPVTEAMRSNAMKLYHNVKSLFDLDPKELMKFLKSD